MERRSEQYYRDTHKNCERFVRLENQWVDIHASCRFAFHWDSVTAEANRGNEGRDEPGYEIMLIYGCCHGGEQ